MYSRVDSSIPNQSGRSRNTTSATRDRSAGSSISMIRVTGAGDADAGVALVALVEADDHGGHPFERARARERPASSARPATTFPASSSASALAPASSPQTKASSSGRPCASCPRRASGGPRRPGLEEILRALCERPRVAWRASESQLGDAEQGRRADRLGQRGGGRERRRRPSSRARRGRRPDGLLVRRAAGGADFARLLLRALRVARADHDLVARLDEARREREPEVARAADDGDLHAGTAPSATSASRRRASASLMSVRVTIGRTSPSPSRSSASASSTTSASIRPW